MVFDRDIRLSILGSMGVGKTSLIKRLKGEDTAATEKTMDISVERKKMVLLSAQNHSKLSLERYRKYNVIAVDNPGDGSRPITNTCHGNAHDRIGLKIRYRCPV